MRFWQDFLDSLNSDGGHILMLVIVFFGTVAIGVHWHLEKADDVALQAFGALLLILKTVGSNKTRRERPETDTETQITETTSSPKPKE